LALFTKMWPYLKCNKSIRLQPKNTISQLKSIYVYSANKFPAMKKVYPLIVVLLVCLGVNAQNNVGIGTPAPDPTSILDLTSSSQGFLAPRLTTAQRTSIVNPAQGLLVYDTNIGCYFYYNGAWTSLCQLSGPTGPIGSTGATGAQGVQGVTGSQGPVGATGTQGVTGSIGPTGPGTICGTAASGYITMFTSATNICNSALFQSGNNVGLNTTTPSVSFQDNGTDAIGLPAGTTAQEPAGAPTGAIRYNTTLGVVEVYNGTCWQNINTPPVGATYIQWFNAADPNTLYPCTQWVSSDISNGEFIRAVGGASNVATGFPLTGALQAQQLLDHTHNITGVIDPAGAHNHSGSTGAVNTYTGMWIPYDDNLSSDAGGSGFGNNDATTCGSGWNGEYTVGNFMGQLNDACLAHTHIITTDGQHIHTITITDNGINSGQNGSENRPANVAVVFWRRTN
jgi:collagen triple helix repeat protein